MYLESLNAAFVIDTFLLLLTGIGPKIALVPFLDTARQMPRACQHGEPRLNAAQEAGRPDRGLTCAPQAGGTSGR